MLRLLATLTLWLGLIFVPFTVDAANLVVNGGFEDGTNHWTYDIANAYAVNDAQPDFFGAPIAAPGDTGLWNPGSSVEGHNVLWISTDTYWTKYHRLYQTIDVVPGLTYRLTAALAGGAGGDTPIEYAETGWLVGLYAGHYDHSTILSTYGKVGGGEVGGSFFSTHFDWQTVDYSFVATSDVYTVYLAWTAESPFLQSHNFGAYFDNVTLTPVPEPSTFWLLAIGCAGLMSMASSLRQFAAIALRMRSMIISNSA